jgi:hypothetical protein
MTLLCLWFAKISIDARRQKEAIDWVLKYGGHVRYDWERDLEASNLPGPEWLHNLIGVDYFQKVVSVDLTRVPPFMQSRRRRDSRPQLSITDVSVLRKLPHLEVLRLRFNQVEDISPLRSLKELKDVNLADNRITDCTPLLGLHQLNNIQVQNNPLSAEMIDKLRDAFPNAAMSWSPPPDVDDK